MTAASKNADCMGCHESERAVLASLQTMSAEAREHATASRMEGGGASLVAQWMLDDPRSCASCHRPKGSR